MNAQRTYVPLHILARRTGLPAAWLKSKAVVGRLPHIKAGRRLMFNSIVVEQVLSELADITTKCEMEQP